jgi:plasmid stabilization system protein ParE
MNVIIGALARQEIIDGTEWYENQQRGLGVRFKTEIKYTIDRIVLFPDINTEIAIGIRRCLVKTFPYMVIYSINKNTLEIIAVAHQHRRPGYWKKDA